jgi:proline dehydrogenase
MVAGEILKHPNQRMRPPIFETIPPVSARATEPRLRDRAIARSLPLMPKRLVRRLSAPYIAGDTIGDAIATIRRIEQLGMSTTLDVLGEAVRTRYMAELTRDEYLAALDRLAELGNPDLVNVSVKLTALGLGLHDDLAAKHLRAIVKRADELGGFVRIDMEDSPFTDRTLDLYEVLRREGFDRVGVVIQAYLKRSRADVERLCAMKARVRVVKGIYLEPESIAFRDMRVINRSYLSLCEQLAEAGCHAAYATHDEMLVWETQQIVERHGLTADDYEYQMLLGVRESLRDDMVSRGYPTRIYVPFGARWYEYSIRRLRENPTVAGYVAGDVMRTMRDRLTRSSSNGRHP